MKPFNRLFKNRVAKVSVMAIIGLVLAIYIAAFTLPDAITQLTNTSKYGATVPSSVLTLMTTVGGIVVAVIFFMMLLRARR